MLTQNKKTTFKEVKDVYFELLRLNGKRPPIGKKKLVYIDLRRLVTAINNRNFKVSIWNKRLIGGIFPSEIYHKILTAPTSTEILFEHLI